MALPTFQEDQNKPEHIPSEVSAPKPKNEIVDAFREEINRWFARYQTFYDRTNAAMRTYRLAHVDLVSTIYMQLMTIMGDRIEEVRSAAYELNGLIADRIADIGQTQCITNVQTSRDLNSRAVSERMQACATYANVTLSNLLTDTFYPTFSAIQVETSIIPISVIDVLSKGNVLEDEQAILAYLEQRFQVLELQWLGGTSQLLRWETNRFENEGLFLNDQIEVCMLDATWEYLLTNSRLEGEVLDC